MVKASAVGFGLAVMLSEVLICASCCWDEVLACAVINEQSSSLIVTTPILSQVVAWQALLKSTSNCSVASHTLSFTMGIFMVAVVVPAANCRVPSPPI